LKSLSPVNLWQKTGSFDNPSSNWDRALLSFVDTAASRRPLANFVAD